MKVSDSQTCAPCTLGSVVDVQCVGRAGWMSPVFLCYSLYNEQTKTETKSTQMPSRRATWNVPQDRLVSHWMNGHWLPRVPCSSMRGSRKNLSSQLYSAKSTHHVGRGSGDLLEHSLLSKERKQSPRREFS
jgi:hypothetical protein